MILIHCQTFWGLILLLLRLVCYMPFEMDDDSRWGGFVSDKRGGYIRHCRGKVYLTAQGDSYMIGMDVVYMVV